MLVSRVSDSTEAHAALKQQHQQQQTDLAASKTAVASSAQQIKELDAELQSEKRQRASAEGMVNVRTRDALQKLEVAECNVRKLETQNQVTTGLHLILLNHCAQ